MGADRDTMQLYASLLQEDQQGSEALRASQQMLQLVMASIPQAIFWKDRELRFLGCNQVFAEVAGLEADEIIGKTDDDLALGGFEDEGHRSWDTEVMRTGKPAYDILEPLHRPGGDIRWLETNKVPLIDFDGQVVGVLGTFQDVTARLRVQQKLKQTLDMLDERVQERTSALSATNETLRQEVAERARLQQLEQEQRAYAEALRDIAATTKQSLRIDDLLDEIIESLGRLVDHDLAAVLLVDDQTDIRPSHARFSAQAGREPTEDHLAPLLAVAASVSHDDVLLLGEGAELELVRLGADSCSQLIVPIARVAERMGYLVVESAEPERFSEQDVAGICFVADQAVTALTNTRYVEKETELAAMNERQHLARELHDAVSQTLWTACLSAESLDDIDDPEALQVEIGHLKRLTRGALAEMRNLLLELRPAALEEAALPTLLRQLTDAFASRKEASVQVDAGDVGEIATDAKLALYRITQEALNNVARHATPEKVSLELARADSTVTVEIVDDGGGFDASSVPSGHLGLRIMAERAEAVGGICTVTSVGGSTSVWACVPVGVA